MIKYLLAFASAITSIQAQYSITPIALSKFSTGVQATATYLPASSGSQPVVWDPLGGFYFVWVNQIFHVNQSGTLDRVIGDGFPAAAGDGGLASADGVEVSPIGLAVDSAGNLFFSDSSAYTVRRVDAVTGILSRYAGGGQSSGSSGGDGGPATSAVLDSFLGGVALDSNGNLYIADGKRVRKVAVGTGIITSVANSANAFGFSGDGGPALAATFRGNWGVAVDASNNIYVGDTYRIRKITASTGIISTIAGNDTIADSGDGGAASAATLFAPSSLGVDSTGTVYITTIPAIRKITPQGVISSIASSDLTGYYFGEGGPAASGMISGAGQLAVNASGDLLYTDSANSLVIKIDSGTTIMHTVAGTTQGLGDNGPVSAARFSSVAAMAFDSSGNLYVADAGTSRVRKISASTSIVTTVAGNGTHSSTGDGGAATSAGIAGEYLTPLSLALAIDSGDNLYIADYQKIRKVDAHSGVISTLAVLGTGVTLYDGAYIPDMVLDGGYLYVILNPFYSGNLTQIRKIDVTSGAVSTLGSLPDRLVSIDHDVAGGLYLLLSSYKITKMDEQTAATTPVVNPPACAFGTCPLPDAPGSDLGDGGPALDARLYVPQSIRANHTTGDLFIADTNHARLRLISGASGTISTIAGDRTTGCLSGTSTTATSKFTNLKRLAIAPDGSVYTYDGGCAQFAKLVKTPAYAGYVDSLGCNAVSGWAADRNRLGQSITVKIYDGANLLGTVVAGNERADIGTFLNDNGAHAFSFALPSSVRDGSAHAIHVEYEDTTLELPGSPKTLTCGSGTNYAGYVDSAACSGISGWVADRNRPGVPITVSLWDGSTQIASTTASASRSDVGGVLNDNGLHGFSLAIPAGYANGIAHVLQVRYETSLTAVPNGGGIHLTCGTAGVQYAGYVDVASCSGITGWVADRNRPGTPITVSLWDGATQIGSATANGARPDVGAAINDNGAHGFSLAVPAAYQNGVAHSLQVHYESSASLVPGTAVNLTCGSSGANYAGYIDSASCAGITGWAADRNRKNTGITVTLWDGATQIASTSAASSRGDVGAFLGDNGLHGFSMVVPPGYADGTSHAFQIRYETSASQLPGSPAALTCGGAAPNYTGSVDVLTCNRISGWGADRNALNSSISLGVYDESTLLFTVQANSSRSDVGAYLGDNGLHGFGVDNPAFVKDGHAHKITVRPGNFGSPLYGPQTLTCQP